MGFGCEDRCAFLCWQAMECGYGNGRAIQVGLFIREVEGQGQGQQRFYKGYPWIVDFVLLPRLTYV